jgi:hypothetical protein
MDEGAEDEEDEALLREELGPGLGNGIDMAFADVAVYLAVDAGINRLSPRGDALRSLLV